MEKIHFCYRPGSELEEPFAQELIETLGQSEPQDADVIVSVGGDGSLLYAFTLATQGQKVMGLTPPQSNSVGFWASHKVDNAGMLLENLRASQGYEINPLRADITFKDGSQQTIHAFNEVMPSQSNGQAMLASLSIYGKYSHVVEPIRVMGDGIIFSSALGSTAINATYGGAMIDIRNSGIALTGVGIYEPRGGIKPVIAANDTRFEMEFGEAARRQMRVQYDGKMILGEPDNPLKMISIQQDPSRSVELLLTDDPASRAFATLANN